MTRGATHIAILLVGALMGCAATPLNSNPNLVARGAFGEFGRSLSTTEHGYTVIPDPTGSAPTRWVERFEVRPGDCGVSPGWSDCDTDRERSELAERGSVAREGETAWYGWSFYVPDDWPDVWPTKTSLGQFHQDGAHPVWMFLNHGGGLVLDDQTIGRSTRYVSLIDAADLRGRWRRIEVEARWSSGPDGVFRVWVDGDLKLDHVGATTSGADVYFKYGVYRTFVSRYAAVNDGAVAPTQFAYFAGVAKAATRDDLAEALDRSPR